MVKDGGRFITRDMIGIAGQVYGDSYTHTIANPIYVLRFQGMCFRLLMSNSYAKHNSSTRTRAIATDSEHQVITFYVVAPRGIEPLLPA